MDIHTIPYGMWNLHLKYSNPRILHLKWFGEMVFPFCIQTVNSNNKPYGILGHKPFCCVLFILSGFLFALVLYLLVWLAVFSSFYFILFVLLLFVCQFVLIFVFVCFSPFYVSVY